MSIGTTILLFTCLILMIVLIRLIYISIVHQIMQYLQIFFTVSELADEEPLNSSFIPAYHQLNQNIRNKG